MGIFKKRTFKASSKKQSDMPEGLWNKCPSCGAIIDELTLKQRHRVCTKCDHHFTLTSQERVAMLLDPDSFEEMDPTLEGVDSLGFKGYGDKLKANQKKTGLKEAVLSGRGSILGHPVAIGVLDFRFLGGSLNSAVGEKLTRVIEAATAEKRGAIIISSSGGARMHEGILSLMQMAKTSGALARHHEAGLPYISVLTHPTTGGVTASFATLGDINMAEPNCMIGFAGPRVIKETTHQNLPPGFQTAEFLLEHGLIDVIVPRSEMRDKLGQLLGFMLPGEKAA